MNIEDMVLKQLIEIEAAGLCNPEIGCGCPLDDLMPCEQADLRGCVAAQKGPKEIDSVVVLIPWEKEK